MENKTIILDSGMKNDGSSRYYSTFRAPKTFWNVLIDENI